MRSTHCIDLQTKARAFLQDCFKDAVVRRIAPLYSSCSRVIAEFIKTGKRICIEARAQRIAVYIKSR